MSDNAGMSIAAFAEATYRVYEKHYDAFAPGAAEEAVSAAWFDDGSVDAWRHRRMHATIDPLLQTFRGASWLTVGDGRCASDARYLLANGGGRVVATDLSTSLLKIASERGLIDEYRVENAESLSFEDDAFDFVLCKEAYHHFPRPMIALYEMLRVARRGVVLIEPFDRFVQSPIPERTWNGLKRIFAAAKGKPREEVVRFQYESVGNFIYTISARELEKVAAGLNLGPVAFRGFNDYFCDGLSTPRAIDGDATFEKVKREIARLDRLCKFRIRQPRMMTAILFKSEIAADLIGTLEQQRFSIPHRAPNPYL